MCRDGDDFSARHGPIRVSAARELPQAPETVYGFLACLDNHWHLSSRYLRVDRLNPDRRGGRIVAAGPLGLRRTARTTLTTAHEPHRFGGVARVGRSTRADVQWRIEPAAGGARVVLEMTVCTAGIADRWLLALGGRSWLQRAFDRTLNALADTLEGHGGDAGRAYRSTALPWPLHPAAMAAAPCRVEMLCWR